MHACAAFVLGRVPGVMGLAALEDQALALGVGVGVDACWRKASPRDLSLNIGSFIVLCAH